MILFDIKK